MKKLDKKRIEDILELTPMQEGMLFHYLKDSESHPYFEQLSLEISGAIAEDIFEKAWHVVIQTNQMLRTVFRWEKLEHPIQIVLKQYNLKPKFYDISDREANQRKKILEEIKEKDRKTKLDLQEVPFRVTLCKVWENQYEIILSNHHILYDGWSSGIILEEFFRAYDFLSHGKELERQTKTTFKEFVRWNQTRATEKEKKFWKDYLNGFDTVTELPIKRKVKQKAEKAEIFQLGFGKEVQNRSERFVRRHKVGLSSILYTAWGLLLQRYNNCDDVVFGTTVSGRTAKIKGIENIVGLFINTIPLRIRTNPGEKLTDCLNRVDFMLQTRGEYEHTSLVKLKEFSELAEEKTLFNTIVVIENYPLSARLKDKDEERGLVVNSYSMVEMTNYDLTVGIAMDSDWHLNFIYYPELFADDSIVRLAHHFKGIVADILNDPDKRISDLEFIPKEEKNKILYEFNHAGKTEFSRHRTIHRLTEIQAKKTPNRTALVYKDRILTYGELNKRANGLAGLLRKKGAAPDVPVGMMVDRSLEKIIGIIAVLKAGGAYLPVDKEDPENRVSYMLNDSGVNFLLVQQESREPGFNGEKINLDDQHIYRGERENVKNLNEPGNIAYIIYTSGSTGKPKGVLVEHRNAVAYIYAFHHEFNISSTDVFIQQARYVFDVSVKEIFATLSAGGKLVIPERREILDIRLLLRYIKRYCVTIINCSPLLLNELNQLGDGGNIRLFIGGGDVLKESYITHLLKYGKVYNAYGPTEATISATFYRCPVNVGSPVPIGKPIANYNICLLGKEDCLQPIGVPGELCISGVGVARGYLNRPELTAEKFVFKKLNHREHKEFSRFYRTGDLAKWLPDGNIEFAGRLDKQVKIRGFRIELEEIETQLGKHWAVKDTLVTVKEIGAEYLCAYVVPMPSAPGKKAIVPELKKHLSKVLPAYMVPAYFVLLEKMPLTANGKIDTRALPEPGLTSTQKYIAPRSKREKELVHMWAELLAINEVQIGIDDNFFELGGHSLNVMALVGRIHKTFDIELPIPKFFNIATVREISRYINEGLTQTGYQAIAPAEEKKYYELSSTQRRLFFIYRLDEGNTGYNMPSIMEMEGDVDTVKLQNTFAALILRHESLRTSFHQVEGEPFQKVHDHVEFKIESTTAHSPGNLISRFVRPFDLSRAPLLRVGLIKLTKEKHLLMVDMHHIISDGVSVEILVREFLGLYEGERLPLLKLQYKDYSQWQNRGGSRESIQKQGRFWKEQFMDDAPMLHLPADYPRPPLKSMEGDTIDFDIAEAETRALNTLALHENSTLYMVILGIFSLFLSRLSNQEDIVVGTPAAGRRHADLEPIIGPFINTLPIRNFCHRDRTFKDFLVEVRENTLRAFENQEYPYEELVEQVTASGDLSRNPLFDVMFIWENAETPQMVIPGLTLTPYQYKNHTSKFDLILLGKEQDKKLFFTLRFSTKLFKEGTIRRFIEYFKRIVSVISVDPGCRLFGIEIISDKEKHRLLYEFNDTETAYPGHVTLHELFEEQVEKTPDRVTVVGASHESSLQRTMQVSYRLLNERAGRLANKLTVRGVAPGKIVAILMERSVEMIIGILAILKAGGVYLPVDPEYPEDRIRYMLADSGAGILLSKNNGAAPISGLNKNIEVIDFTKTINKIEDFPAHPTHLTQLCYVIYTSGSTGKPKGVLVEHRNAVAYIYAFHHEFNISSTDVFIQQARYVFDVSVKEIFATLSAGGKLVIPERREILDIRLLSRYIKRYCVTIINCSPLLLNELNQLEDGGNIRLFIGGGDVLKESYITNLLKYGNVYNAYGPTEATISATFYRCPVNVGSPVPIGKPIANYNICLLGKEDCLQPSGVPGELCISGVGVARGYLNRPELTAEKFVFKQLKHRENKGFSRFYRTGDLAKWLPDGNIEFAGRLDKQVKIRGFRIELEEIETQLGKHWAVKDTLVTVKNTGTDYLCAYVVPMPSAPGKKIVVPELKKHLSNLLPAYMVPAYFVLLDKMPLTANGKIDTRALPEPGLTSTQKYIAPRTKREKELVHMWAELLAINEAQIGIDDNFFELGGHSLNVMALVGRVHKTFDIQLPIPTFFNIPTVREIGRYINEGLTQTGYQAIEPAEKKEYYELSSTQRRLFFIYRLDEGNTGYNMPSIMEMEGDVDAAKLQNTFAALILRHESLRTSFHQVEGGPFQKVHDHVAFKIQSTTAHSPGNLISRFVRPFDLSRAPLLRVGLIKGNKQKHLLMVDMHHIISDGVSVEILVREFLGLYEGEGLPLLKLQYKDYSQWQNRGRSRESIQKQGRSWKEQFMDDVPMLHLPADYPRPPLKSMEGDTIHFDIAEAETRALHTLALQENSTLYMVILGIFSLFLSRLSNQEDIVVGTPAAGRRHADLEPIIGPFINTLAIRNFCHRGRTFKEFLEEVRQNALKAFENQEYPYEELVEQVTSSGDLSRNPLFDVMFIWENAETPQMVIPGLTLTPYRYKNHTSKFDLTLIGKEQDKKLLFIFEYSTKLFKEGTIKRFIEYFKRIVSVISGEPGCRLFGIEIISDKEKHRLLYEFNDTETAYPGHVTIHELFEEQVEKTPDRAAVVGASHELALQRTMQVSYRQLNERAGQLADQLSVRGVAPGKIVAILMERSVEMIIGILAILKAGGAYLPIDPGYPEDRIRYMLADSGAGILLSKGNDAAPISGLNKNIEVIDLIKTINKIEDFPTHLTHLTHPTQLCYVIYTSGSTGKPKGILIGHKNAVNFMTGIAEKIPYEPGRSILAVTTISFDIFLLETLLPLTTGVKVVLADKYQQSDPVLLRELIEKSAVDMVQLTPSRLKLLRNSGGNLLCLKRCSRLMVGGEEFPRGLFDHLAREYDGSIYNLYGPTETTVWSTLKDLTGEDEITVGKPIANTQVYILDSYDLLQPIGVAGELCIAGDGVGKGYVNKPALTFEKFIPNPLKKGERLYRTGDLARWLPDGDIEFLGRLDLQVKIRGFRIELEEIETHLTNHGLIKDAVVIARTENRNKSGSSSDANKYLCAYVVLNNETALEVPRLREYLSNELPDYMIPSHFVPLDHLPLTANGKINKKALPEPDTKGIEHRYQAPRNDVERRLAALWAEVLDIEEEVIGIQDNFFHLGGHSLKAALLTSRMHREFNIKISLTELFRTPSIKALSGYMAHKEEDKYTSIKAAEKKEYYPLSSAQKRLYILNRMDTASTDYNMPGAVILEGEPNIKRLEEVLQQLIRRHESLRTSFCAVDSQPVQRVHTDPRFEIQTRSAEGTTPDEKAYNQMIQNFIRPFDLSAAPLLRVGLTRYHENKYLLIMDMHHIISDAISLEIFIKEFRTRYRGEPLSGLTLQYKDYSEWQNIRKEQYLFIGQEAYWLKQFEGDIPVLDLPADYIRPVVRSFAGNTLDFEISAGETQELKTLAAAESTTMYMVLLSLYSIFLAKISGQEDIIVGTPVSGRRHADLEPIIGMFVNTLALKTRPEGTKSFARFLSEIKQNTLQAFENQDYPYEDLVENVVTHRDVSRNPLFDVMFALHTADVDIHGAMDHRLKLTPCPIEKNTSKFDLTLHVLAGKENLVFTFEYCTKLFKKETVQRFINDYKRILSAVLKNKEQELWEIEIISEEGKKQVLYQFNHTYTSTGPGSNKSVTQLFEDQTARTPGHTVLVLENHHVTYGELNRRAGGLAGALIAKGVEANSIVALMVHPALEMVVGILGILKAGGAYLPLDPQYPAGRINYMLEDSRASLLLTQKDLISKAGNRAAIIDLEDETLYSSHKNKTARPGVRVKLTDLAYVIYTSGSTGKPKGTLVEHRTLKNLCDWHNERFWVTTSDRATKYAGFGFDASVWEIFPYLVAGASLYIITENIKPDVMELNRYFERNKITISFLPTRTCEQFMALANRSLRILLTGGDKLKLFEQNSYLLVNNYGPTENTVVAVSFDVNREYENIPIGSPVSYSRIYILDKYNRLQPVGIAGELCISGYGLARGYLNKVELSKEKFQEDILSARGRMYRSGDRARWLADGNIEFLGRIDQQVKIRGYRIEPGEIENQLLKHEHIIETFITTGEDRQGDKYLCAYIVSTKELLSSELREYLARELPAYMIPAYFVPLEHIPLTPNGKVDLGALPQAQTGFTANHDTAPGDEIEKKLVEIWADILGIEEECIGMASSFFELGGHSLNATLLILKIHEEFNVKVPLPEVFREPYIRHLAKYIKRAAGDKFEPIQPVEEKEYYPMSSAQKRMFLVSQFKRNDTSDNTPDAIIIEGILDKQRLEEVFKLLIKRHEALRTSFQFLNEEPIQRVHKEVDFEIGFYEAEDLPGQPLEDVDPGDRVEDLLKTFVRPFDLGKAPLLRVSLVKFSQKKHVLLYDVHHIIRDGSSSALLIEDFFDLYREKSLPALKVQYKDFTIWQNKILETKKIERQKAYWLEVFPGELPVLNLPTDFMRPTVQGFDGGCLFFRLSAGQSRAIKTFVSEHGATLYMFLLSLYNILLSKYSDQEDIVVGTPIAGRPHSDLNNVMGMFANTLAMRNYPRAEKTFLEFFYETKTNCLKAYENQDYPFEELVNRLGIKRDPGRSVLFDTMFVVQNMRFKNTGSEIKGVRFKHYRFNVTKTQFDIMFHAFEADNRIAFKLLYSAALFKPDTIERFVDHFKEIVTAVIADEQIKLKDISISHGFEIMKSEIPQTNFDFGW